MSMTKEEAIKYGENKLTILGALGYNDYYAPGEYIGYYDEFSFVTAALSALRPVSREQVEKVWRGCPECKPRCGLCAHIFQWDKYGKPYVCESCVDFSNFESDQQFCEVCGAPMTDEAVQMVMERMEKLKNEIG